MDKYVPKWDILSNEAFAIKTYRREQIKVAVTKRFERTLIVLCSGEYAAIVDPNIIDNDKMAILKITRSIDFWVSSRDGFNSLYYMIHQPNFDAKPINSNFNVKVIIDLLSGSGYLFDAMSKIQNSLTEFINIYEQLCLRVLNIAQD